MAIDGVGHVLLHDVLGRKASVCWTEVLCLSRLEKAATVEIPWKNTPGVGSRFFNRSKTGLLVGKTRFLMVLGAHRNSESIEDVDIFFRSWVVGSLKGVGLEVQTISLLKGLASRLGSPF